MCFNFIGYDNNLGIIFNYHSNALSPRSKFCENAIFL